MELHDVKYKCNQFLPFSEFTQIKSVCAELVVVRSVKYVENFYVVYHQKKSLQIKIVWPPQKFDGRVTKNTEIALARFLISALAKSNCLDHTHHLIS